MTDLEDLVDLAAKRLGGMVVAANDEFFAPKENLLEPAPPVWIPDRYTDRGKWMDGWETRRRRDPGHDWCIVRLGLPGIIRGVVVDTSHFTGNYPESCSLDGWSTDPPAPAEPSAPAQPSGPAEPSGPRAGILPRVELRGNSVHRFSVDNPYRFTHVRFNIYPDGGVARLRVYGEVLPDRLDGEIDLAAVEHGGLVIDASGEFFAPRHNLVMPGQSQHMGDGWETRRRRGPGHDWAVVRLAARGEIHRAEVDTSHYKGNHPDTCSLDVCDNGGGEWREVLARTPLQPHRRHLFDLTDAGPATHARLSIYPDGGVARLRLWGTVDAEGLRAQRLRRLNALLPDRAEAELLRCCGSTAWARLMTARRPFRDPPEVLVAADEVWRGLRRHDWLQAFAAHPRIGERRTDQAWAMQEQAATATAGADVLTRLRAANHTYEDRYGHLFIVCAAGKSAEQMLALLEARLDNPPDDELQIAADEQRKITALRLEKLLGGA